MEMPDNICKWVIALRSGDYNQTKGTLKRKLENGNIGHCCLGVYVESVAGKHIKTEPTGGEKEGADKWYEICNANMPSKIKYAGIKMNDAGKSFEDIADMIEEYYKNNKD